MAEINRFEDVIGVVTQADTVEGRFVVLTSQAFTGTYININDDLPGAVVPATAEDAKRAKFLLMWAVDNRTPPYINYDRAFPASLFDTRGGFGGNAQQGPLTGLTMYLTQPGHQEGLTIPSGYKALGYTEGTFTFPSGAYIDSAEIKVPGAAIIVANTADDGGATEAGKPKYTATMAAGVIGFTESFDSATGRLTIRVE